MEETAQPGGPTTNIRLYLRASNLPKSITQQRPDTLARISLLPPQQDSSEPQLPPPVPTPGDGSDDGGTGGRILDDGVEWTEVVTKSSNPKWTASFSLPYEYGSQLLVFVDIFAARTTARNSIRASVSSVLNKRGMKHLGRAVFDVPDVLGNGNNVKARRLRKGGIVYAHVEQQSSNEASPSRSLSSASSDSTMLTLRLRADSLVHTHSIKNRVAPNVTLYPDTYFEISRQSSSLGSWIVVYRSPPVKESVSPAWDEAIIDLASFGAAPSSSASVSSQDLSMYSIMITVYKVKTKKCKEIGSFQTTVANLIDASKFTPKVTGYENERASIESGGEEEEQKTFQLRPTARGGANPSGEITGNMTVVFTNIEKSADVARRSQRFLLDAESDNTDASSVCPMIHDDLSENINKVLPSQVLPSHPRPKFADYVRAGTLDIDFCVAIDFTSSNGDPRIPGTQHFSRNGMMNDYEEAIVAVGSTIEKYSSSQEYPVWGFGAKYGGMVRHIFQCGSSPTANGTHGVLDAYRAIFETDLTMSGPTEMNSVIRAAAARSKRFYQAPPSKSNTQYCVLLILTDGIVHNLQSTKELVRSCRENQLPLSVIVVGIGRADFTEFHQWNRAPSDVRGRFKFVEFRQHQYDPDTLSREALLNVPHETVEYFLARNILPH